jgi:O-antigen/teichoic acid export membrane protein
LKKTVTNEAEKAVKSTAFYTVGSISRQIVSFIMLPIYTTYLSPADYGVVGLISFAIIIIESIFGARLMSAVPKFYNDVDSIVDKNLVITTALWATGIASSIIVFFMIIYRYELTSIIFGENIYTLVFSLFAIQTLTQAVEYYGLMYIRIKGLPALFLYLNLSKLILQIGLNIGLIVYAELGILGVALSGLIATTIFSFFSIYYIIRDCGISFDKSIALKMVRFSWPLWVSGLGSIYINSSNRYFLRIYDSLTEVGLLELASKFSALLLIVVWIPIAQYWTIESYRIYKARNSIEEFEKIIKVVVSLLASGVVGISLLSTPIIHIMADSAFHDASLIIPIIAYGLLFSSLEDFLNFGFMVQNKNYYITVSSFLSVIIVSIIFVLVIPSFGLIGATIGLTTVQFLKFVYAYYFTIKFFTSSGVAKYILFILFLTSIPIYFYYYTTLLDFDGMILVDIFLRLLISLFMASVFLKIALPKESLSSLASFAIKSIKG